MASPGVVAGAVAAAILVLLLSVVGFVTGVVGAGPLEGGLILLVMLTVLGGLVLTVAVGVHALVRKDLTGTQRIIWILIAIFVPFGALVYFLLGRARTAELFRDVGGAGRTGATSPPR